MSPTQTTTVIERCRVAPSPAVTRELSLSLTSYDLVWLAFHQIQRLLFYDFPCSQSHFVDKIIPDIKHSLSVSLKHFLPLSGNLIYPLDGTTRPLLRYTDGDSVLVTFSMASKNDFDFFTGKGARKAVGFQSLVPQLPPPVQELDHKSLPVLALQVTLFPDAGISIGYSNHHVVGDARTIVGFIKAWAAIHKLGGDEDLILDGTFPPPVFDRSAVKYTNELDAMIWNQMKHVPLQESPVTVDPDKVRVRYVIDRDRIQKLKEHVLSKRPLLGHVTTFTVTCAYVWTCVVRSDAAEQNETRDDDEFLICPVDLRERLDPPAPGNYFGNCLGPCLVKISRKEMLGSQGFVVAAESLGSTIHKFLNKEGGVLAGSDKWLAEIMGASAKSMSGVAGSPKFDMYEVDYGWGKPKTYEAISIDAEKQSMSMSKSRECEGGLEVGVSLPQRRMDAFADAFEDGFRAL